MSTPGPDLVHEIGIAEWAYELAPGDATPAQLCELIVTALAEAGCLRGHAGGLLATTVEGTS